MVKNIVSIMLFFSIAFSLITYSHGSDPESQVGSADLPKTTRLPGVDLAEGFSAITGIAISPLAGVSLVGWYTYFRTPEEARGELPWFMQKNFLWITLGASLLLLSKDFIFVVVSWFDPTEVIGEEFTGDLKRLFDRLEQSVQFVSAGLAAGTFVPWLDSQIKLLNSMPEKAIDVSSVAAAGFFGSNVLMEFLQTPILYLAFLSVFLFWNLVNSLICYSPFTSADLFLKTLRGLYLSIYAMLFYFEFYGLLLVFSLLTIYVSIRYLRWFIRLHFFTLFMIGDVLRRTFIRRFDNAFLTVFTATELKSSTVKIPKRTFGKLHKTKAGDLYFSYRPWFFRKMKNFKVDMESASLSKGLIFSSVECTFKKETYFDSLKAKLRSAN